jgi:hypothetical protein
VDLKSILEKNKGKVEKYSNYTNKSPSIASHDRPYVIDFHESKELIDSNDISSKIENSQETNGYQTGNKQVTNGYQTGNKRVSIEQGLEQTRDETGNKRVSKQVTNEPLNGYQTGNKRVTNDTTNQTTNASLSILVGVQRNIILFFYFLSKKTAGQSTHPLTLDFISKSLEINKNVIKTTIIRLQKKGLIFRNGGKTGRGGWTAYELSNTLYKELMHQDNFGFLEDTISNKQAINGYQTGNKEVSKQVSKRVTTDPSSSSVINIKNTTTNLGTNPYEKMSVEWQTIDFGVLTDIGFNKTHLVQLYKAGTQDPKIVQDSIYHFAFDLKHNGKKSGIKGDVLNFFMGIISKRAYTAPTNYINPDVEAMNAYMKTKEREQKQKEELELKTQDLEFNHWHETLSDEEINRLVSDDTKAAGLPKQLQQTLKMSQLKKHFKNFVWPEVKRKILNSTPNWKSS